MKQSDDLVLLGDILDAIRRVEDYTRAASKEDFLKNFMMQDAVMHQIEIIGELICKLFGIQSEMIYPP